MDKLALKALVVAFILIAGYAVFGTAERSPAARGGGPGTIVVVGEEPIPLEFTLGTGVPYQLDYPTAKITLWDSPDRTTQIPPGVTFTSSGTRLFGDVTGDGAVDLTDLIVVRNDLGTSVPGTDLDGSGQVESADLVLDRNALDTGPSTTTVTVYAEGLIPSTALGDTQLELLVDADEDGAFRSHQAESLTVVSLEITPTTVKLGTAMVTTLQPAVGQLVFDGTTTASWSGNYVPTVGSPVALSITYDAAQVRETSTSQATLVAGDGSASVPLTVFSSPGDLVGTLTFDFNGIPVASSPSFTVQETQATLYEISYGADGTEAPTLGAPAVALNVAPGPVPSEEMMLLSIFNHYAVVVPMEKNPETLAGPSDLTVQVISMDGALTVVQDSFEVALSRLPDDTAPDFLFFVSDLQLPIFPINVPVDRAQFSQVIPFETVDNGLVLVVPQGVSP